MKSKSHVAATQVLGLAELVEDNRRHRIGMWNQSVGHKRSCTVTCDKQMSEVLITSPHCLALFCFFAVVFMFHSLLSAPSCEFFLTACTSKRILLRWIFEVTNKRVHCPRKRWASLSVDWTDLSSFTQTNFLEPQALTSALTSVFLFVAT